MLALKSPADAAIEVDATLELTRLLSSMCKVDVIGLKTQQTGNVDFVVALRTFLVLHPCGRDSSRRVGKVGSCHHQNCQHNETARDDWPTPFRCRATERAAFRGVARECGQMRRNGLENNDMVERRPVLGRQTNKQARATTAARTHTPIKERDCDRRRSTPIFQKGGARGSKRRISLVAVEEHKRWFVCSSAAATRAKRQATQVQASYTPLRPDQFRSLLLGPTRQTAQHRLTSFSLFPSSLATRPVAPTHKTENNPPFCDK